MPTESFNQREYPPCLATLRRFVRRPPVEEACDLCHVSIPVDHPHLVTPGTRQLVCACDSCARLFSPSSTRYKLVPRQPRALADLELTEAKWNALGIPIGLAFFLHSSADEAISVLYPSPAGPIEAWLRLESWQTIVEGHPGLAGLSPDVEALVVNRLPRAGYHGPSCLIVPIDTCYRLVGLIRAYWRGFNGGPELWEHVDRFFIRLTEPR
jgi:hypothetical protein